MMIDDDDNRFSSLQAEQSQASSVSTNQAAAAVGRRHGKVMYRDLSHCEKPNYLAEYKSNCWGQCRPEQSCSTPPTAADISAGR